MTEDHSSTRPPAQSEAPEAPKGRAAAWLSRVAGLGMLSEQSVSHALGKGSDLILVGAGLCLLAGKEGIEFVRLILGRSEPPSGSS